jgi:hypothetical protein
MARGGKSVHPLSAITKSNSTTILEIELFFILNLLVGANCGAAEHPFINIPDTLHYATINGL